MAAAEACLREGPNSNGVRVLFVPPLFEEANRMRRTIVLTMRALAARGFASMIPDLPGQNDSLMPTDAASLTQWRSALQAAVTAEAGPVVIASLRGGALLDNIAGPIGWWRLAPATGASLLRTMLRTQVASDREAGKTSSIDGLMEQGRGETLLLAGNRLSPTMLSELQAATPAEVTPLCERVLGTGDNALPGTPLWLRAEPGEDRDLAVAMANDLAIWAGQCDGR